MEEDAVLLCIWQHLDVSLSRPQTTQFWIRCWRKAGRYHRELPLHLYEAFAQNRVKFFGKIVHLLKIGIIGQLNLT